MALTWFIEFAADADADSDSHADADYSNKTLLRWRH